MYDTGIASVQKAESTDSYTACLYTPRKQGNLIIGLLLIIRQLALADLTSQRMQQPRTASSVGQRPCAVP